MSIILNLSIKVEFLMTVENLKSISPAIRECKKYVRCLWVDKNKCITTAFELTNSKEDLFPVYIYRVVPSSELSTVPFNSPNN